LEGSLRVVVVVVLVAPPFVGVDWEPPPAALPPHPATANVAATAASSVSMAASDARFIGRPPVIVRGSEGPPAPPYQAFAAPIGPTNMSTGAPPSPGLTHSSPSPSPVEREQGSSSAWLLAVCCVAQFMVILDLSIVNVALPSIQSSLGFSSPELQWVVDAYAITFAGFLMLGGRAADHFGQRRMFVAALALFALASLAGGLAPDRGTLIGARAVQGLSGALMAACSLAIITSSFPPGPKLHRAIGIWAAMNGAGGAAGVLFGGIITQELSWRWILLINPPIAMAAALVAYAVVNERRRAQPKGHTLRDAGKREGSSFDLAGALTLTVGQMVLVYGVVEAGLAGWDKLAALGPIIAGLALLAVFGVIEARLASAPLIPFKELTKPLRTANNIVLLFSASLFPMWFVSSLYLQQVLGLSPLHTGLIFLPMTLTIMLVASRAGRLVSRFGVRPVLGGGLIMLTAGMLLLARVGASGSGVVYVMIPGLLAAAGIAMSIVPSTIAATQSAKEGQAGLASGLVNTSRQVGGGLGLALLVTLATQRTTHLIGAGVLVPQALTDGFRLAYLICAGLAAVAAVVTFTSLPGPATATGPASPPAPPRGGPSSAASATPPAHPAIGRPSAALTTPPVPAARRLAIAIGVVVAGFVAIDLAFAGSHGAAVGAYTTKGAYSFLSMPSLHPPKLRSNHPPAAKELAPGYILTASFYDLSEPPMVGQSGPLILDRRLQPVWFDPVPESVVASNLSLQTYKGKPALAWWQGVVTNTGQTESGEYVVVNQHYQEVARLKGADGWVLTLHEFAIRGDNVWVTANKNIPIDLSKYGGAYNGAMIDSAVQEYNLKTGKLLRTWDARDHIPLNDSYATLPTNGFPWDAYHVNAVEEIGNDTFMVSIRNTWAAYLVNIETGKIEWTLGGRHSSFKFAPGAAFQWQHDVALRPDSTVTMFDDHCCQITSGGTYVPPTGASRGLTLKLDQQTHTATLAAQYTRNSEFDADYMGNSQPLQNGNVFIGWGSEPYFSEFSRSGKLLFEGEFPRPDLSYRATLEQWVGLPLSPPVGAARQTDGKTTVYASWNGATQVASWRVLARHSTGRLTAVTTTAKSGFETAIPVPPGYDSFKVEALGANGRAIGASRPFSRAVR
jgi:EmrB/QacA subfamily drug resistance transporter